MEQKHQGIINFVMDFMQSLVNEYFFLKTGPMEATDKMMEGKNEYMSQQVIEMLTVANEFCLFMEKADEYDKKALLDYLTAISPLLYLKARLLPPVLSTDHGASMRFVTEENWERIYNNLRTQLFPDDEYTYDYMEEYSDRPGKFSIAEDFSDCYQDLKDFVMLYQQNTAMAQQAAVADCRHYFATHWGPAILRAQNHMHHLIHAKAENPNENKQDWLL